MKIKSLIFILFFSSNIFSMQKEIDVNINALNYLFVNSAQNDIKVEFLVSLLNYGVDINTQDAFGRTVLMYACINNNLPLVKFLMDKGANAELQDIDKKSAFDYAKSLMCRSYLKVLETRRLKHSTCDSQEMNEAKRDMFDCTALVNSNKEIVKMLIQADANVNATDKHGYTALMQAASSNYKEIIKLLIEYDNNSIINQDSYNIALMLAIKNNHKNLIEIIQER